MAAPHFCPGLVFPPLFCAGAGGLRQGISRCPHLLGNVAAYPMLSP